MNFDPDDTAVVVVDMQNDFCDPEGALYAEASEAIIPVVNGLTDYAREEGAEVVFTRDHHHPSQFADAHYYDEFDQWGEHAMSGEWGQQLHDDIDRETGDWSIDKPTYDAFHDTGFHYLLTEDMEVNDLLFVGTLANVCVLQTAASAGLRDYKPVLVEDALGYITEDHKEYALDHADFLFGETTTTEEVSFTQ